MKRLLACLIAALIVAGLGVPVAAAAEPAAAPPKVVFVVGPVGAAKTARLRAQADEAARIARRYTPDVVKIYSPNATWPVVRDALQGASLVIYMGHGNGWPSRYRDSLYPPTQNGFGLNPVAGGGDSRHQYFGEKLVGSQIKLAKDAVVLLHHLCYASGNTEPGLPEGTFAQARQRVDNYAAGFIRAGASAVIAEAISSPAYNVKAILGGSRSIDRIWRNAPTANGNFLAFASKRSPGYVAQMDPERSRSKFHRSIVLREGLAARDVLAGGQGGAAADATDEIPAAPSLIASGIKVATPVVGLTTAGSKVWLRLPYTVEKRKRLPKSLQASLRWEAIEVAPVAADPATEQPAADPSASAAAEPGATPSPEPSASPEPVEPAPSTAPEPSATPETVAVTPPEPALSAAPAIAGGPAASVSPAASTGPTPSESAAPVASPDPDTAGAPAEPPSVPRRAQTQPQPKPVHVPLLPPLPPEAYSLLQPEQPGEVVSPAKASIKKKQIAVSVRLPANPGLYRLIVTLHDKDGVAYDAASQALIPPLLVRVVGEIDGKVLAAPAATLEAGSDVPLTVRVVNLGKAAWGQEAIGDASSPDGGSPAVAARLIGHWVPLDADGAETPPIGATVQPGLAGGATADTTALLSVPSAPGEYLLLLDVVTPGNGSLAALGVSPTIVRVTVVPQP